MKNVGNVSWAHSRDEERFSGKEGDYFHRKLRIFNERLMQNGLEESDKPKVFSIMLKERASYYFADLKGKRIKFEDLCGSIWRHLPTEEHTRGLLRELDSTTFETIMSKNSGKKTTDCPDLLVARPQEIQSGLTKDSQKELFLKKSFSTISKTSKHVNWLTAN